MTSYVRSRFNLITRTQKYMASRDNPAEIKDNLLGGIVEFSLMKLTVSLADRLKQIYSVSELLIF